MTKYETRMNKAIQTARSHIQQLKKVSPYIFPEWNALQQAQGNLKRATAELVRAEAAWNALGTDRAAAALAQQGKKS